MASDRVTLVLQALTYQPLICFVCRIQMKLMVQLAAYGQIPCEASSVEHVQTCCRVKKGHSSASSSSGMSTLLPDMYVATVQPGQTGSATQINFGSDDACLSQ